MPDEPAETPAEPGPEATEPAAGGDNVEQPTDPPPDQPDTPAPAPPAPEWGNWEYTGPDGIIYTAIPLTAANGAVLTWHSKPADDGRWQPTDAPATVLPDNHRPDRLPPRTAPTEPAEVEAPTTTDTTQEG